MYMNTTPISHHTNNDQIISYNNTCIQPKYYTTLHTLHSACYKGVHGHVQDHIIKPIDNTNPVGTSEYVYIRTSFIKKKKLTCKRDTKRILLCITTTVILSLLMYECLTTTPYIHIVVSYAIQYYQRCIISTFERK